MIKRILFWLVLLGCGYAQAQSLDYPSIWECDAYKPNWYCDREDEHMEPTPVLPPAARKDAEPRRIEIKDIRTAEQLRQELKRREDIAVMNPSEANVKDYLALWQLTQEKGSLFSDVWRRVVWQNPELDYAQRHPANNTGVGVAVVS